MPLDPSVHLHVRPLESRFAPATLVDASTVTFRDTVGDIATVFFSKPLLTAANADSVFKFDTGTVNGDNSAKQQLQTLDLIGLPKGLSVAVTGVDGTGNPTKVDVGFVNATGLDEKAISISGDLGRVVAGDANKMTPGLGSLAVGSLGLRGTATQAAGGTLNTVITGGLGRLTVAGDVTAAFVNVDGKIGKVSIGGSLTADGSATANNGSIRATLAIGPVTITGDVKGGPANGSGVVYAAGNIGKVAIGGNLLGGGGSSSGQINSFKKLGKVSVAGNVTGGGGDASGSIYSELGDVGKVTIGGNVTGEGGGLSGSILGWGIASIAIAGDVTGGAGGRSGFIWGGLLGIGPVTVKSLKGGAGKESAEIYAASRITSVTVSGDMTGGDGAQSGSIHGTFLGIGPVLVLGNIVGGNGDSSASIIAGKLSSVTVDGSVTGGSGKGSACIVSSHSIGKVKVGGSWTGASIAVGWTPGADGYFGTADDVPVKNAKGKVIVGTIGSITIGGKVEGIAAAGDAFAFLAADVKALSINGAKVKLKAGLRNDNFALGTFGDFNLIEK